MQRRSKAVVYTHVFNVSTIHKRYPRPYTDFSALSKGPYVKAFPEYTYFESAALPSIAVMRKLCAGTYVCRKDIEGRVSFLFCSTYDNYV